MAALSKRTRTRRLARSDWVRAAVDAIGEGGLAAVAVEPLARRLGVTKGSFYAHFTNRDELVAAALAGWERTHGAEGLAAFAAIADPAQRLRRLFFAAITFSESRQPSAHVSLLAEHEPRARAAVRRVDAARIAFIADTYRELGLPPARARRRARLAYATYIGLLQLARHDGDGALSPRQLNALAAEAAGALVGSVGQS